MSLQHNIAEAIAQNDERIAFVIDQVSFSYKELGSTISKIRGELRTSVPPTEKNIGLIITDALETYASIYAIWLEGKAYVPLSPDHPEERNNMVVQQAQLKTVLDASGTFQLTNTPLHIINTKILDELSFDLGPMTYDQQDLAYILFTSGTTGIPKGVMITYQNVSNFIKAFEDFGLDLDHNDRFLQMFQLTFDPSVLCFLFPLLKGASVYTIPDSEIKYSYIVELLEDYDISIAVMVPSVIRYLRPYFDEINCDKLKFNLFCGEGLPVAILDEWSKCVPNAQLENIYGPTENTIVCTRYIYNDLSSAKAVNGILSIGKPMKGNKVLIVDDENNPLPTGEKGELCLSGWQLAKGYWKNEEKNKQAFFDFVDEEGNTNRFYKTGDACSIDDEGDIAYLGRIDFQAKIQGFRVELSEVEFYFEQYVDNINLVAVPFTNKIGNTEIGMVLESNEVNLALALDKLKNQLPSYMIPTKFKFIDEFPLNISGKIDRKKLIKLF